MSSKLSTEILHSMRRYSERRCVSFKTEFMIHRFTYDDILSSSKRLIALLENMNVRKGDRVVICSYNCPQYFYAFIASVLFGIVLVPLDYSLSEEFVKKIIKETNAKLFITTFYKNIDTKTKTLFVEEIDEKLKSLDPSKNINLTKDNDLLQILYTSGTTSDPKGVMLTHDNIYSNLKSVKRVLHIKKEFISLSIIPLSHSFEQIAGFFAITTSGAQTIHMRARKPSIMLKLLRKEKVNILITVPAFLELLKRKIEEKAAESGRLGKLNNSIKSFREFPRSLRKVLFKKVRNAIGPNISYIVSGGAPLNAETEVFFEALGMKVIQGYGLTECSPVVTLNPEYNKRIGSVGLPLPGVLVKLAKDNEVLVKGRNVTQGYYKNRNKTKELFWNGWLLSGDIGSVDDQGFLYIKSRKKNMILKSSGLNVYPEDIELLLDRHPLVKESCVIGRALEEDITICSVLLLKEGVKNKEGEAKKIIEEVNKKLEQHQKIQEVYLWKDKDFPKTPTLKIQRRFVTAEVEGTSNKKSFQQEKRDDLIMILSKLSTHPINERSMILNDLGLDSINIIELSLRIEEKFGVEIDEQQIDYNTKVSDLRKIINEKRFKKTKIKLSKKYYNGFVTPVRFVLQELIFLISKIYCTFHIKGYDNIRNLEGQFIIVSNHQSHLDLASILKHLPSQIRFRTAAGAAADHFFLKKKKIDHRIFLSRFIKLIYGAYPFDRKSDFKTSLEFTGDIIDMGLSVMLFPEGTRTLTGQMNPFKAGIGIIVKESQLPVIPIRINGLYDIFPKHKVWPKKKGDVEIIFGRPIEFRAADSVIRITKHLENTIKNMR